jgi:hypothetical protein
MSATRNHFALPINMMVRDRSYESASFYDFDRFDLYKLQNNIFGDRTRKISNLSTILKGISRPKNISEAKKADDYTVINVDITRFSDLCLDENVYTLASEMAKKPKKDKPTKSKKKEVRKVRSKVAREEKEQDSEDGDIIPGFSREESKLILTTHAEMLENIDENLSEDELSKYTSNFSNSGVKDRSLEHLSASDKKNIVKKLTPNLQSVYGVLKDFVDFTFDPSDTALSIIEQYDVGLHLLLSNNLNVYFGKSNACQSLYQESQHLLYYMLLYSATGKQHEESVNDDGDDNQNAELNDMDDIDDPSEEEHVSDDEVKPKKKRPMKPKKKTKVESDDSDNEDDD